MPGWLQAGLWGLLAGSALLLGAGVGYFAPLPRRVIAGIMAFGSGVLISALSFELMDVSFREGGAGSAGIGAVSGAVVYSAASLALARRGAKHRKRSGDAQSREKDARGARGSGIAIAMGALLDGIPESIVIGVSLLAGGTVSLVAVAAVFLSNVPEGLSSSAGMRQAGRSRRYVFGVWGGIALASGLASLFGYLAFRGVPPEAIAVTNAVAAGAILAMLSDTMIPEAFEGTHDWSGLITVLGFLSAFVLSKTAG